MTRMTLANGRYISTQLPALVMGIINLTANSFWEQSRSLHTRQSVEIALQMEKDGADIIDLGAESSRPGSPYVTAAYEIEHLVPVIAGIREHSSIAVSVDTRKKEVLSAAFNAGADILNDISALEDDENLASFCAANTIPVILMHKRGKPDIMQHNTSYADIIEEVRSYLYSRAQAALNAGISADRIWLDVGIGFAKNTEGNCALLAHLHDFTELGFPLIVGLSRKSVIGELTGRTIENRLIGTVAANQIAVMNGARMLRVHDVAETVDMLRITAALKTGEETYV